MNAGLSIGQDPYNQECWSSKCELRGPLPLQEGALCCWTIRAGAEILAIHLEGPFLALTGALPPEALGAADPDRVRSLIEAARPHRAIFSISPDFEQL